MLDSLFIDNNSEVLFISFSPLRSEGKYLFRKAGSLSVTDALFFNDTNDKFYLDDQPEIINIVNSHTDLRDYKKLVIVGFSAGSFMACAIAPLISFKGPVEIHAFSPHVHLNKPHSTAWNLLNGHYDLSNLSLSVILENSSDNLQYHLYFSTESLRDGIHLCDSFLLDRKKAQVYLLKCDHDTTIIVRQNYPQSLVELINGTFYVSREFLSDQNSIFNCILLSDIGLNELNEKISKYSGRHLIARDYDHEFCYWHSRQLNRMGHISDALAWGWAAIAKSPQPAPDSYAETLGNIAFDNGLVKDAIRAYRMLAAPSPEVNERINRFL